MNRYYISLIALIFCLNNVSWGKSFNAEFKNIDYRKIEGRHLVELHYLGELKSKPILTIKKNIIQLEIPNSIVWPKIDKKVTFGTKKQDTSLSIYQYNKDLVRFRIQRIKDVKISKGLINISNTGQKISISLPINSTKKISKNSLNEDYLNKLLLDTGSNNKRKEIKKDAISTKSASVKKNKTSSFLTNYTVKFIGFLILVIGIFYTLVQFVKRGTISKGKMNFLKNGNSIEVLNTNYLAPKKSLVLVKVIDQIFLISNSDTGISMLSEINNPTAVMKNTEKEITGDNFDISLDSANQTEQSFKLKTEIEKSNISAFNTNISSQSVKMTDKIKQKVKGLKSFQQL